MALVLVGLVITSILLVLFLVIIVVPKAVPVVLTTRGFLMGFSLLGFLCGLATVITLAVAIPGVYNEQFPNGQCTGSGCNFFGEKDEALFKLVWGPSVGWIAEAVNLLFEFILFLGCLAFSSKARLFDVS
jgi:hypothetical protein